MSAAVDAARLVATMGVPDAVLAVVLRALSDGDLVELVRAPLASSATASRPTSERRRASAKPHTAKRRDGVAAILEAVRGGASTAREIAQTSGSELTVVRATLTRLVDSGRVVRQGERPHTTYSLPSGKRARRAEPERDDSEDE